MTEEKPKEEKTKIKSALEYLREVKDYDYIRYQPQHKKPKGK